VLLDASTITAATTAVGADSRPNTSCTAGVEWAREMCLRLHVTGPPDHGRERSLFDAAYQRMATTGLTLRDPDDAWERTQVYRATYAGAAAGLDRPPHGAGRLLEPLR
jgi:hypothetical protein